MHIGKSYTTSCMGGGNKFLLLVKLYKRLPLLETDLHIAIATALEVLFTFPLLLTLKCTDNRNNIYILFSNQYGVKCNGYLNFICI